MKTLMRKAASLPPKETPENTEGGEPETVSPESGQEDSK